MGKLPGSVVNKMTAKDHLLQSFGGSVPSISSLIHRACELIADGNASASDAADALVETLEEYEWITDPHAPADKRTLATSTT